MGLLIALDVVAAYFLTIKTPFVKIGLSFIPVSFTGIALGPVFGGVGAAIADVIQYVLYPQGAFIPGITFDAFLSGAVYGLLLHKKVPALWRCLVAAAICELIISAGLTTIWLYLATPGKTLYFLFMTRIVSCLIRTPIEAVVIFGMWKMTKKIKAFSIL